MNQIYQTDPLLHNYLAPAYPIFIQLKYLIGGLNAKKALKNAKSDITHVRKSLFSLLLSLALRVNVSYCLPCWKSLRCVNSRKNHRPVLESVF